MRRARKALAASFVLTFAAGCDSKSTQPAAAPTVDLGNVGNLADAASAPAAATSAAASASDTPPVAATATADLAPAPSGGRVVHNPDGSCSWFAAGGRTARPGGRGIIMNPPPPRRVLCPADDGGT